MTNEIKLFRGDTRDITVTVYDTDGSVLDLTDYTMTITVKKDPNAADASAALQTTAVIASPATGVGVFGLTAANTNITPGTYSYDVQVNKSTRNVYTVLSGTFQVLQDITQT